jgi:2-succinyl-5-enolpyruvyl-6-hydroxy-3-cyclohexene-1-carboxylate synthase
MPGTHLPSQHAIPFQPIYDIAEVCARRGLSQAVLCPGSRCAPLILAFARHHDISAKTISDERSAGFMALGIAHQLKRPAILVCTSGSATFNFGPAVAEAFYQRIPLLILTADRPQEWLDQFDGQTIQQREIFGKHVKKSFTLPEDYSHPDAGWFVNRSLNEAINLALTFPEGPVHVNLPFREPLYPAPGESITYSKSVRIIESVKPTPVLSAEVRKELSGELATHDKILVIGGQHDYDERLLKALGQFTRKQHVPLVGDIISNMHSLESCLRLPDLFLSERKKGHEQSLQPELLITFGKSVISKNLKLFIRRNKPLQHWHIQESGPAADTFQSLTKIISCSPRDFFDSLMDSPLKKSGFEAQKRENFLRLWEAEEHRTQRFIDTFFAEPSVHELNLVRHVLRSLPPRCCLHLANSMSVRYANFIGLTAKQKGIHVFANRGTSGIDGCSSTAVGHSLSSDVPHFLITGDMAFFYDRNAFWNNYPVPNLHIIVLNNHGGIIFNLIDGPADLPERDEFFVTQQKLSAENLCSEFGFDHILVDSTGKIENSLKDFFTFNGRTKVLELETTIHSNKEYFWKFKSFLKKEYESK